MKEPEDYQPIENYGVIGDLNTIALVGLNGSIDFMCFPDFDSPSVFARILDKDNGGYFHNGNEKDNEHKADYACGGEQDHIRAQHPSYCAAGA